MSITINPINQNIQLTRGDSFSFTLRNKTTGGPFTFDATDIVTMTVRQKISDIMALFSKAFTPDANGQIVVVINPDDTKTANYGTYVYDIQWSKLDGSVYTLIPKSGNTSKVPTFQICQEVTRG